MSIRASFSLIAVAVIMCGCTPQGPTILNHPPAAGATTVTCSAAARCDNNVLSTTTVQYEEIHLKNGSQYIHIVWHLPEGYAFCKEGGMGGVVLKLANDGQFTDMYSTDDPNGGLPADKDCKKHRHFHWKAKNSIAMPNNGYEYLINFYDKATGTPYSIDPWIFND